MHKAYFENLHMDPLFLDLNFYIYTLLEFFWQFFGYEISIFLYTTGWYLEQSPTHTSLERFHLRMNVKNFLMFTVAENTGNVNIVLSILSLCSVY